MHIEYVALENKYLAIRRLSAPGSWLHVRDAGSAMLAVIPLK